MARQLRTSTGRPARLPDVRGVRGTVCTSACRCIVVLGTTVGKVDIRAEGAAEAFPYDTTRLRRFLPRHGRTIPLANVPQMPCRPEPDGFMARSDRVGNNGLKRSALKQMAQLATLRNSAAIGSAR
jgi:hypothetical protein